MAVRGHGDQTDRRQGPITAFWVGTHKGIGVILLALIVLRALWGLYNMKTRPAHGGGFWGWPPRSGIWRSTP
ncbi:hypothetical protein V8F63_14115 [Brevundimonas sp. LF-1]|uniref:hypothetical protein n=1 Tax=Brevundimonas sp. LF-1 TaxID=3126100 RepID=UPI0030DDF302